MNNMTFKDINWIVEQIRLSFQTRDFKPMVGLFADDAVYETPFALDENQRKLSGYLAIRERFNRVSESTWNKAVHIQQVSALITPASDNNTATVQFSISGERRADGSPFNFSSSVAIIRCDKGKIIHYQDYPNILGINKAAGLPK